MPETTVTAATTDDKTTADEAAKAAEAPKSGSVVPAAKKDDGGSELASENERLKRELTDARSEAGKTRVNAKEKAAQDARSEVLRDVAKSLGLAPDEDADPAELRKQIDESQTETREVRQELAVYRGAAAHQANADKLLDSRSFLASIKDIDPTDTDAIAAAIKKAVDADETLKIQGDNKSTAAAQAAKASGTATTGGSGEGAVTPEQFKAMGYDDRVALLSSNPALYRQLSGR